MSSNEGVITRPKGFSAVGVHCGLKSVAGRPDLGLLVCEVPATAAGCFTTNRVCSPAVVVSREHVRGGQLRGVVVNAGNANACTGEQGLSDARRMTELAAAVFGCKPGEVAVASTGIIGHPLPMQKVASGIEAAGGKLSGNAASAAEFSRAICTTDRWMKESVRTFESGSVTLTVAGTAKGAGMISPKMATMLAFVTTDAKIGPGLLQKITTAAVNDSFNRTTVDGDMSTNDTVLVLASGLGGGGTIVEGSEEARQFANALTEVCLDLARSMARDGEGATKLVTVHVKGAVSNDEADRAARQICNSLLVKTAMCGGDPTWGRIVAAAGSTGIRMEERRTVLKLGGEVIYDHGVPQEPTQGIIAHMKTDAIEIKLDLGLGKGSAVMFTCDLGHDYVTLNAEYHT